GHVCMEIMNFPLFGWDRCLWRQTSRKLRTLPNPSACPYENRRGFRAIIAQIERLAAKLRHLYPEPAWDLDIRDPTVGDPFETPLQWIPRR
ncbi:MAG: hypothetical protein AAGC55_14510, partial [Myxococcota bacterium]